MTNVLFWMNNILSLNCSIEAKTENWPRHSEAISTLNSHTADKVVCGKTF